MGDVGPLGDIVLRFQSTETAIAIEDRTKHLKLIKPLDKEVCDCHAIASAVCTFNYKDA